MFSSDVRQQINKAVAVVRKSLDATRNPRHPADVPHTYVDKFHMVELASRAALAVQLTTLTNGFGITPEVAQKLQKMRSSKTVTVRLDCFTTCDKDRTETREEESVTRGEKQNVFGKTTYKTVTTVTEHFWKYKVTWSLRAFIGSDMEDVGIELVSRTGEHEIMTRSKEPVNPLPSKHVYDPIDTEITWLLDCCSSSDGMQVMFDIDRTDPTTCHTPCRNENVNMILENAQRWGVFCEKVSKQVTKTFRDGYRSLLPQGAVAPNFSVIDDNVFVPVSVMLAMEDTTIAGSASTTFTAEDFGKILQQQQQEMAAKFEQMDKVLPTKGVITMAEAALVVCSRYSKRVWQQYKVAVQAVEDMLMAQLIAAIGKRIGPNDFAKYMDYHNRQLYRPEFAPKGFCYAIRRPDHYPEGTLSIENGVDNQPASTMSLYRPNGHTMKFALSAAVEVSFEGEHFVHCAVFHKFSNSPPPSLTMIARARQFSSFILMTGSLHGADVFQPSHALIIKNKDELKIPLILETIPAPQEFRDAIESLSPEQQAFCKAYRKMQLAGTLFAVAVVQIKPQLERLLNLPNDALTKEVKLCQDLMSLFIEYQIPSDLLTYDGPDDASSELRLTAVKKYVKNIHDMLDKAKQEEIEEEERKYRKLHPVPVPPPPGAANGSMSSRRNYHEYRRNNYQTMNSINDIAKSMNISPHRTSLRTCAAPILDNFSPSSLRLAEVQVTAVLTSAPAPAPVPAPAPAPAPDSVSNKNQPNVDTASVHDVIDYTQLPGKLDASFERLDRFNSLRATKIKLGDSWTKSSQKGLLSEPSTSTLSTEMQRKERSRAFDLLDALSKSGARPLFGCTMHVVLAATHCFDLDLLNTVVQDNINPIEQVEASGLIMASTIHDVGALDLVADKHRSRIENLDNDGAGSTIVT